MLPDPTTYYEHGLREGLTIRKLLINFSKLIVHNSKYDMLVEQEEVIGIIYSTYTVTT